MKKIKLAIIFVLVTLVGACVKFAKNQNLPLTPSTLNLNSEIYDGSIVVVHGFLLLNAQGRHIYESEKLDNEFRNNVRKNPLYFNPKDYDIYCLTLLNADFLQKHKDVFSKKTVTIKGRFKSNYLDGSMIDLQACPLPTALILDDGDIKHLYEKLTQ
jgi:hypothetical protein